MAEFLAWSPEEQCNATAAELEVVHLRQYVPSDQFDVVEQVALRHSRVKKAQTDLREPQFTVPCELLDVVIRTANNEGTVDQSVQVSRHCTSSKQVGQKGSL